MCMAKTPLTPDAGLAMQAQLGQGRDPLSLMLSCLLVGSYCLGVIKGERRRRVRRCCIAVPGVHPKLVEEMLLLFFLFSLRM